MLSEFFPNYIVKIALYRSLYAITHHHNKYVHTTFFFVNRWTVV